MKIIRFGYMLLAAVLFGGSISQAGQEPVRDCRSDQLPKKWVWEVNTNNMADELEYLQRGLGYRVYSDEVGFVTVTLNLDDLTHQRLEARTVIFCQAYFKPKWVRVIQLTMAGQNSLTVPLLETDPVLINDRHLNSDSYHRTRIIEALDQDLLHPDFLGFYFELNESGVEILRHPSWVGETWYLWLAYKDGKGRIVPVYGKSAKLWLQKQCKERPSSHCSEDLFEE